MNARKQLSKLEIRSFKNRDFTEEYTDRKFITPINPESFTKNFKVELDTQRGHGNQGSQANFKSTAPEELRLEFVLDGTKTMEGYGGENKEYKNKPVHDQLDDFLKCVYDMSSEIHRPRFLIVFWGSEIDFRCVLSNLDVNFTLFDPRGHPIRVKVNATFLNYKAREERLAEERRNSPDMTHYRLVKQGDRLDYMTHRIYGDPKYFLQVGRHNKLTSIRNIQAGRDLYFPPFDKNET